MDLKFYDLFCKSMIIGLKTNAIDQRNYEELAVVAFLSLIYIEFGHCS